MRSATEIVTYVLSGITEVYQRPFMYAETPVGIEIVLHLYHDLWAMIMEREKEYVQARSSISSEEGADADSLSNNFAKAHPESTEEECMKYVLACWQRIDELINLRTGAQD